MVKNCTGVDYDPILCAACSLLEYTDRSITEICMDSGFESQRTFNRAFQERYRMQPREYRQSLIAFENPTETCRTVSGTDD